MSAAGISWGPQLAPGDDPFAKGKRKVDVPLPAAANAVIAKAGPRL